MAEKLARADRDALLETLPDWQFDAAADAIVRKFRFDDFSAAFGFMSRVALLAEKAGHHPDWSNSYDKVRVALSTHDAGGVSRKDTDLARKIDALLA